MVRKVQHRRRWPLVTALVGAGAIGAYAISVQDPYDRDSWIATIVVSVLAVILLLVFFGLLRSSKATEYKHPLPHRHRVKAPKGEPPEPFYVPNSLPWYQSPSTGASDRVRKFVKRAFKTRE